MRANNSATVFTYGWTLGAQALLAAALGVGYWLRVIDPDVLLHLKTGELISEAGLPRNDLFSASAAGNQWVTHEWLWQWLTYQLFSLGGWPALNGLRLVLIAATFAFCMAAAREQRIAWFSGLLAAILLSTPLSAFAEIRPQLATYALFAATLLVLEKGRRKPELLWILPPIFLLWANLHGAFLLGIVLLTATLCGWAAELVGSRHGNSSGSQPTQKPPSPLIAAHLRTGVLVLIASIFAGAINPSHFAIYFFPFKVVSEPLFRSAIYEWAPPNWSPPFYPFYVILAIVMVAAITLWRALPLTQWIILIVFAVAGFQSRRQIPFFYLAGLPLLALAVDRIVLRARHVGGHFAPAALLILAAGSIPVSLLCFERKADLYGAGLAPQRFPETPAAKLAALQLAGAVFNDYNDGGFLIWRLWPAWKVCMDGRVDVYGPDTIRQYQRIWSGKPGWQADLERWNVQAILGRYEVTRQLPKKNLYHELATSKDWSLVYWDDRSILYVKSSVDLAETNLTAYRRVHPGLTWKHLATLQTSAGDWQYLGADLRRALSEEPTSRWAATLLNQYESNAPTR